MLRWFARRLNEARKDERGFTLIELLVVVTYSKRTSRVLPLSRAWKRNSGWFVSWELHKEGPWCKSLALSSPPPPPTGPKKAPTPP